MSALVIRADTRHLPLPDASVDLIVTSPPYFGLRSYLDDGEHYDGQIGSEANPAAWLEVMADATREWIRVLKPAGSMFVNLGDKYASGGRDVYDNTDPLRRVGRSRPQDGFPGKTLLGLPWRYALACVDQLGLILRAEIVWSKPNGLPESVTDRVRRSHETWFHLVKQPRYYCAIDEIREPYTSGTAERVAAGFNPTKRIMAGAFDNGMQRSILGGQTSYDLNPLGKLPGSVWTIPSEAFAAPAELGIDHFAAFPTAWPKRLIQGWAPTGICTACQQPRRPVSHVDYIDAGGRGAEKYDRVDRDHGDATMGSFKPQEMRLGRANRSTTIIGYACACTPYTDHPGTGEPSSASGRYAADVAAGTYGTSPLRDRPRVGPTREHHLDLWTPPPTTQAVVLDPFGGTGTTALVASALGRTGISVDLSHDYSRLAAWRTTDRAQIAKVLQVDKPPVEAVGQEAMF